MASAIGRSDFLIRLHDRAFWFAQTLSARGLCYRPNHRIDQGMATVGVRLDNGLG